MSRETTSPIKNLPVRVPGQSLDEQIDKVFDEKVTEPLMGALIVVVLAIMEWWRYVFHITKPLPILYSVMAVGGVLWATWKMRRIKKVLDALKLGRTGERAVGQYLEEQLRPVGYQVLHDIPGDNFNLDHVVIGPTGIFCIETKTFSRPTKGATPIKYDGETITKNGFPIDRDPVIQAKAASKWLCELLEASTGKRFFVQPVVLFPGWYVEAMPMNAEAWVLNDKAAIGFIRGAKTHIPPEDVSLATFHLKRYIISETEKQKNKS